MYFGLMNRNCLFDRFPEILNFEGNGKERDWVKSVGFLSVVFIQVGDSGHGGEG
jgi:hypothetical protein